VPIKLSIEVAVSSQESEPGVDFASGFLLDFGTVPTL
jgi:hypothetical protein